MNRPELSRAGVPLTLAVDIGGTFTDIVVQRGSEVLRTLKLLTPADRPETAVLRAVAEIGRTGTEELLHASTLATNALLHPPPGLVESVGLLTTEGFRDVLEIGRQNRPGLYDLFFERPRPLVDAVRREEVRERILADGRVHRSVVRAELRAPLLRLARRGVRSLAISFLHAYANPANERRAAHLARERFPFVSVSSEVAPEPREFERTSTTVVNALLKPVVSDYTTRLRDGLRELGVRSVSMMASSGGLISLREAAERPAQTVESGPAAGVVATAELARRLGVDSAISFDMGGTTAKAGAVFRGRVELVHELEVGGSSHHGRRAKGTGYPVRFPFVDLAEVLAGGGTVIRRDDAGSLRVGPDSAGALPGPMSYGRGGVRPTLTDANLVLGVLGPSLLGKSMALDVGAARRGLGRLGSTREVANAAVALANLEMARAIRLVTVERGRDPGASSLVSFGGAGPQHAAAVAEEVGIRDVIVPRHPGVFSALGLLQSEWKYEARSAFPGDLAGELGRLRRRLRGRMSALRFAANVDVRYRGQGSELSVPLVRPDRDRVVADFVRLHEQTFGFSLPREVELVTLRLFAFRPRRKARVRFRPTGGPVRSERPGFWDGRDLRLTVWDREGLPVGTAIDAPAAIEEYGSCTFVPPGWRARVLPGGELRMRRRPP